MLEKKQLPIEVRPYSMKELRHIYGLSFQTFKNWIEPLNLKRNGRYYTPEQVEIIFNYLGVPHHFQDKKIN
jgi:hypothetical protein